MDADRLSPRVRAFAAEHTPALASGRAVLAISGGADSIATAALLVDAGIIRPDVSVVAHFDHRLRDPRAAARDRDAIDALCARYGLPLETAAWRDPRPGEAAARDARYRFLAGVARRHNIDAVVTGHTSDDQVETVIMHALRGAGLHGLRGMSPQRPLITSSETGRANPEISDRNQHRGSPVPASQTVIATAPQLARPMLCLSREDTRAYCAARDLAYNDDITNDDPSYFRNRIRLDLLPRIDAAAPDARAAILRLASEAREGVAALEAVAAGALDPASTDDGDSFVALSRAKLSALPPAVIPYAWRLALQHLLGDARDFDRRHYNLMSRAMRASTGSTFELPRGVRLTVDAGRLILSLGSIVGPAIPADAECSLPFDGVLGAWRIAVTLAEGSDAAARSARIALPAGAVVRGRRPGDRMQPYGMRGHKKLQDYYVDRKIPRRDRDAAPVIAAGGDVLWTPFGAAASPFAGDTFRVAAARASNLRAHPLT
jgi:tRNA(Ile)-lysidine synthase